ncbi:MAG: MmcQ/YjbR family DNA-binding protein [Nocardioidaceae bacterium]|nr:MmcQ/YjbR family DNA-binding protein [Nocardioidaceae bacterium]
MAHPIMFSDDDPGLAELREICLALPDAVEFVSHGRPCFKAGEKGKVFASFGAGLKTGPGTHRRIDSAVTVKIAVDELPAIDDDEHFFLPMYAGTSPWRATDLARPDVDWTEIAELIDASYRNVAARRLIAALDAAGG